MSLESQLNIARQEWERKIPGFFKKGFWEKVKQDEEYIDDEQYLKDVNGHVKAFLGKMSLVNYWESLKTSSATSKATTPEAIARADHRHATTIKKHLPVVEFILIPQLREVVEQNPASLKFRFNWQKLCREWNRKHPDNEKNPEQLKKEYNRAVRDKGLQLEFYKRRYRGDTDMAEFLVSFGKLGKEVKLEFAAHSIVTHLVGSNT